MIAGEAEKVGPVAESSGGAVIGRAGGSQITILAAGERIATTPADAGAAWRSIGELLG